MRPLLWPLLGAALLLSGCSGDSVRSFDIHVGWNDDGKTQYMTPSSISVNKGEKVRFTVYNDDDPNKDYTPSQPNDLGNFHDVALLNYDGNGDGKLEDIEHEAPAGKKPPTTYLNGNDYFVASVAGTFQLICEVREPNHAALGMKADFVVSG